MEASYQISKENHDCSCLCRFTACTVWFNIYFSAFEHEQILWLVLTNGHGRAWCASLTVFRRFCTFLVLIIRLLSVPCKKDLSKLSYYSWALKLRELNQDHPNASSTHRWPQMNERSQEEQRTTPQNWAKLLIWIIGVKYMRVSGSYHCQCGLLYSFTVVIDTWQQFCLLLHMSLGNACVLKHIFSLLTGMKSCLIGLF